MATIPENLRMIAVEAPDPEARAVLNSAATLLERQSGDLLAVRRELEGLLFHIGRTEVSKGDEYAM